RVGAAAARLRAARGRGAFPEPAACRDAVQPHRRAVERACPSAHAGSIDLAVAAAGERHGRAAVGDRRAHVEAALGRVAVVARPPEARELARPETGGAVARRAVRETGEPVDADGEVALVASGGHRLARAHHVARRPLRARAAGGETERNREEEPAEHAQSYDGPAARGCDADL